ncbi:hypothetical protein B0A50_07726 [Salinomyces thailandicus]|uniref:Uncharacterized protein n=1 Tax=Salinomyces thailandicus TaxID=706561 RepID=A0A4U0TM61_9PEZI|nr:hypothetical protein B0A50_07726 [Salinomyces thailandica]
MDASPLARLSGELRNHIYAFVLNNDGYAIKLQAGGTQHALTKTCRQVRHETLPMYYSLARLNAHLDDGPATPLAHWMETIGPTHSLALNEVNVWDMHMLNATLYGEEATRRLLDSRKSSDELFILRPVGPWLLDAGWHIKDLVTPLQEMGLCLRMFCEMGEGSTPTLSSYFAITRLDCELG